MRNSPKPMARPWMFGAYAVYAADMLTAREAYERLRADATCFGPSGAITLETGEAVCWVNIHYGLSSDGKEVKD
ncbi:hypothetical protein [Noviherbaspirillum sp.]|uniref:hypothetical protein n=1 Tax=Noviherbaspirillum sp. TaxID=1926288 RepID=UPI002FE2031B